ncbi:hypothetical protein CCP4SC76_5180011 [Gammaproteobacteria bacterium]
MIPNELLAKGLKSAKTSANTKNAIRSGGSRGNTSAGELSGYSQYGVSLWMSALRVLRRV